LEEAYGQAKLSKNLLKVQESFSKEDFCHKSHLDGFQANLALGQTHL